MDKDRIDERKKSDAVRALSERLAVKPKDMYAEFHRVKSLIDTGYFGELTFEQKGKLHTELYALERTFKDLMLAEKSERACDVVINVSGCGDKVLRDIQQQIAEVFDDVQRRRGDIRLL